MKKIGYIVLIFAAFGLAFTNSLDYRQAIDKAPSNDDLRVLKNEAFQRGEKLKYRLHYGFMDAGIAELEIKDEVKEIGPRKTYHIVGKGTSKGAFDWFFKVRDRYETYIDEQAIVPWMFIRRVYEGGYTINQDYFFNHYTKKVKVEEGKSFDIPEGTQDMLSAFYAARCLDFSNAKEGDIFTITSFVDKEIFPLQIKFVGKETIKTNLGKFKCLKFYPVVQKGRVFKKEEDLRVWISDDKNHIPIRAQAEVLVGSIKMDLDGYSGLANPISKVD